MFCASTKEAEKEEEEAGGVRGGFGVADTRKTGTRGLTESSRFSLSREARERRVLSR
jgi:hypothetical protein